ncbi:MAG: hypothetical protein JST16_02805 [Bdellovibrionales bacterium]|nr:hypothetical protein [Bdellovibrionales bacterium]
MNNPTNELKQAAASLLRTIQQTAHYAVQIAVAFFVLTGICYLELGDFRANVCEPAHVIGPYSSTTKPNMDKSLAEHDPTFVPNPNKN